MTEREDSGVNYDKVETSLDGGRKCKDCERSLREGAYVCPYCGSKNLEKEEP